MRIAILYNKLKKAPKGMPEDFYAEFDEVVVPRSIKAAIEKQGHNADIVEFDEDAFSKIKGYDFVFNIAEGFKGESRESHIPAICEMLGIPYTGSGVLAHAIALDKRRTKEVLRYHKIPTPDWQLFSSIETEIKLKLPCVVKPIAEGSSKGIRNNSLVQTEEELKNMVGFVVKNYRQPALVEEFLPGREFTAALFGNKRIYKMPIVEILVDKYPDSKGIYTFEHKYKHEDDSFSELAEIEPKLRKEIYDIAISSFRALNCNDFCRVDIRCDKEGRPYVIEVNPIPGIHPEQEHVSYFTKACRLAGLSYDEIITAILYFAFERHGYEMSSQICDRLDKVDDKTNNLNNPSYILS